MVLNACQPQAGLWNNIDDFYPESIQILDFYHCKEHVCQFAKEYFKNDPVKQGEFIENIIDKLTSKKVAQALEIIEQLADSHKGKQLHRVYEPFTRENL